MKNDPRELHPERLSSTDEHGNRVYLHPEDIKGKFRTRRTIFYWMLILFYLVLPWIYINGEQFVLLDLPARKFILFGQIFWGHDAPLLFFIFAFLTIAWALVTSIWGRVWCGWACPQTVFIDAVYRKIELLVEGSARKRKELEEMPFNLEKLFKRTVKWTLYIAVSLVITHTFLGYFLGTHNLVYVITHNPSENWGAFLVMLVSTGIILFDFAWFREQFCIIACPYGRIQSVLMDSDSLGVLYDSKRGEPRRTVAPNRESEGDCINCYQCVKACPTGIDIRRGTQLECIACTQCIDACDNIMEKLGKPKGLIRYDTENGLKGIKKSFFRARSLIYFFILIIIAAGFLFTLNYRQNNISMIFLRSNKTPFQIIHTQNSSEDIVVNHFQMELSYQGKEHFSVWPKSTNPEIELVTQFLPIELKPHTRKVMVNLFIRFPKHLLKQGSLSSTIELYSGIDKDQLTLKQTKDIKLVGPME